MVSTGVFGLSGDHLGVVPAKPPAQRRLNRGTETRRGPIANDPGSGGFLSWAGSATFGGAFLHGEDAMIEASEEVYSSLHRQFKGDLLRPGNSGYEDARLIWNGMFARTPGLIARCADSSDLQNAIRAAREAGLLTAVRCGGHGLAGFRTCDGRMVIDPSKERRVPLDAEARRARFAGGCLLGSVDTASQKAGLVFPSGVVSHTGAAGLVLGGGTGWLTRKFGLSCDNVEAFTRVTADSSIVP